MAQMHMEPPPQHVARVAILHHRLAYAGSDATDASQDRTPASDPALSVGVPVKEPSRAIARAPTDRVGNKEPQAGRLSRHAPRIGGLFGRLNGLRHGDHDRAIC